jgi:hypothetical protein
MSFLIEQPLATLLLVMGGSAVAAAIGFERETRFGVALACGACALGLLLHAGRMMVRADAWGSVHEWGLVATDGRARFNLLLVGAGCLAVGAGAMWLGFLPGSPTSGVLLVLGGWAVFLCGVLVLVMWFKARSTFAS